MHLSLLSHPHRGSSRCEALLAATEAVLWTTDPDGRFIEPQPSWETYTGQPWETHRDFGWVEAVHEDDRAALMAQWQKAVAQGTPYLATARLWHEGSGAYRRAAVRAAPVRSEQGEIVEWVGTITDVHDRPLSLPELHRVNEALTQQLESQAQEMRRLVDLSLDILVGVAADGRLLSVNPAFEQLTGVAPAQAIGRHYADFVAADEAERVEAELREVLAGRNALDFETVMRAADGSQRTVSWRAVGDAEQQRVYAVGRDVTEQKRAAQRTIRAERLEAVGQLTGGIAHDFNNILAAIMGYLEVGLRLSRDERMTRALSSAINAGRRGIRLVAQLLDFARKQELHPQPVDLNRLLQDLQSLLQHAVRSGAKVQLDTATTLPLVMADPTQLEMVVLNLAINARDAMPEGGTVRVSTCEQVVGPASDARLGDLPQGRYGCVSVIDEGVGMDAETLARCFDPFFTTKAPGRGTGLGLSQALAFVQQCGGTLRIDSAPGQGTRVDVLLPACDAAAPEVPAPASLERPTVLVVDDDPWVLDATASLVEALGYTALRAENGPAAINILLAGRPVEVILSDYKMPEMDGMALLQQALQLRPRLAAIVMTGEMNRSALQAGLPGVQVVSKPLQPGELAAILADRVGEHRRASRDSGR